MARLRPVTRMRRYMQRVESGDQPVNDLVRRAVQRQIEDERRSKSKEFEWRFDEAAADRALRWIECLYFTEGEWYGRPFKLEPWQCFALACVFGWVHKRRGFRRFRQAFIFIPRRNGKSQLASAVGLYMLCADNEPAAQVYAAASGRKQSRIVFDTARLMMQVDKEYGDGELVDQYRLEHYGGIAEYSEAEIKEHKTNGYFRPLPKDAGGSLDGKSVHCGILDELHAHKDRASYDALDNGTGSRRSPLIFMVSTAGNDTGSICAEQLAYSKKVLHGQQTDERFFCLPYTVDEGDEWYDELTWIKVNPNLGVSKSLDDMRALAVKAMGQNTGLNTFMTKQLNVFLRSEYQWLRPDKVQACIDDSVDWDTFVGQPCWIGLDLSSKLDITSAAYLWIRDGVSFIKWRNWLPAETVEESRTSAYEQWVNEHYLETMPGAAIDHDAIFDQLKKDMKTYDVQCIVFDQFNAQYLVGKLDPVSRRTQIVTVGMWPKVISEPAKAFEAAIREKSVRFDGNLASEWMLCNAVVREDANRNILPKQDKNDEDAKIDACIAAVLAYKVSRDQDLKPKRARIHSRQRDGSISSTSLAA